ncbi:glycoside hydrolase family 3 C-terminal domain-containing protein [bacterium]|nr:glycoside hydrolase family 3 C-terminal domain-containing protein [bacterium]
MMTKKDDSESRAESLLRRMTLREKIGQLMQCDRAEGNEDRIRGGSVGSVLNEADPDTVNRIQKIAVEESRLGIPLLIARDVIHGFRTLFPINPGLAATWNPELVEQGARIAALEAAATGVNWTLAPMVDIARDPRWGRIAESFGEDTCLTSVMGAAMVRGFQGEDLAAPGSIAACAKHFAGYGAAEGGRDYNSAHIPETLLRDVYLAPFKACVDEGVASFMSGFHDLNGIPCTGDAFLLRTVLKGEWQYPGFVISDYNSIQEMIIHGYCADDREAAEKAMTAGMDMEMASRVYETHLEALVSEGRLAPELIDDAVRRILGVKFRLGLFEDPYTDPAKFPAPLNAGHLAAARKTALQSAILLKNGTGALPLAPEVARLAVFGPMADDPHEQLGTWTFDRNIDDTVTPLQALRDYAGDAIRIDYLPVLEISRSTDRSDFSRAVALARESDAVLLFMGEEAIITGEAHCRADFSLPGAQEELIHELASCGTPLVLIIMAGRPLILDGVLDQVDSILFMFHPGTMGGPAIVDLLFGRESPSGKLPVTFPKMAGQVPIYYSHRNTGRPPVKEHFTHIDDIPVRAVQNSLGNESHYIDAGYEPRFVFGYGLSYTTFEYSDLQLSADGIGSEGALTVSALVTNTGSVEAEEVAQLYVRDLVASVVRPVRELKGFTRVRLKPGASMTVTFTLSAADLSFHNPRLEEVTEPGTFQVWIGGDSAGGLCGTFEFRD